MNTINEYENEKLEEQEKKTKKEERKKKRAKLQDKLGGVPQRG